MNNHRIFRKIISFIIVGVLLCTPVSYVKASNGSSTSVSSGNSDVSSSGGSGSSSGWTYLNDDGYKLTTYILATTDLDYMNSLPSDLKKYIVKSREGMKTVKNNMSGVNYSQFIKKYSNKVSYFGKGSQMYLADYYQQLGNGMCFQAKTDTQREPGYVGLTTSPSSHLSKFEEDGFNSSSSVNDTMVSKYRSEIKIEQVKNLSVSKDTQGNGYLNLGNYCSQNNEWVSSFIKVNGVDKIKEKAGDPDFLECAISSSIANGLYYTGVTSRGLSNYGIIVKKESDGSRITGKTIKVTEIKGDHHNYFFSMEKPKNDREAKYKKKVTCKGYYTNSNGNKVNVKFTCEQVDLLNAFLYKYEVDGVHYTWQDLCVDRGGGENFGLEVSVVVIIEPIKMSYRKGGMSSSEKKQYYGSYANESRNNSDSTNGLYMTVRERAYWLSGNRGTGLTGLKQKKAWSGTGSEIEIDEKYSAGLCLNYVTGEGLQKLPKLIQRMNGMMWSGSSYAEFPSVKTGSGSRCKNNKSFQYDGDYDTINKNGSIINGNSVTNNLTGGIACIGYYHEMDLDSISNINPFPSLTVRHIDSTALNESEDNENVLMRDSISWTVPASIGLAVQHDVGRATFLSENKGLFYAYGNDGNSVGYEDLDSYLNKAWSLNSCIKTRFGNSQSDSSELRGNIETKATGKENRMKVLKKAMDSETFKFNGINIKSISFKNLLKGAFNKSGKNAKEFMSIVAKVDSGDTVAKSDFYSWCLDTIIDYYSSYKVRIPLLKSDEANLSTNINSDTTFWAISGKPLASCSGSYEYYDGAVMSGDQTTQRKAIKKSVDKLNEYNGSKWDSAENRDSESGKMDENIFGETTNYKDGKLDYPGSRAITPLDYYLEEGSLQANVPKNSIKSKFNFFYGNQFIMDRKIGSYSKFSLFGGKESKYYRNGTLEVKNVEKKAYLPSAKIVKSYADVMYDVSIFNNSVGFMEKSFGQTVNCLVDNADQLRASNSGGKNSWSYLILPEFSLGTRMLMGNSCTNKLVDSNIYSSLGSSGTSDFGIKGERKTKEALMTYWNSTQYETHKSDRVKVRDNMFFGEGSDARAYNNVWVPDLGNKDADLNNASLKNNDRFNGSQTATGKMFEITEKIYGITLAYNPEMSSVDSWTYRIAGNYESESKDINITDMNNIPNKCSVTLVSGSSITRNVFADRLSSLGVGEGLYSMPDYISKLSELNTGSNDRNFIKYSPSGGWKFLNGKFDNSGTKKYSSLTDGNGTYTLTLNEGTKPNGYYIDINVGDWITYGDLGTLDAYYDTVPVSKIFDLSLELDTDEEGVSEFDMNSLLFTSDYGIKSAKLTNGWTIEKPDISYNMETKASSRGYNKEERKYIGTVSVRGDDISLLSKTVSSGTKCISMLRSNSVLYQLEEQIVDLKAALISLETNEVIYYINIWAKGDEEEKELIGDTYIRSDELISAAKVDIPNNSLEVKVVAKPDECKDNGHQYSQVEKIDWKGFNLKVKNSEPWRVLGGTIPLKNPFTVLGKIDNGEKLFGMEWLDKSEDLWTQKLSTLGDIIKMPKELSIGVLLHRSTVDTEDKKFSLTPPLAEYMNNTSYNKKYKKFCNEYDVTVDSYSGKGSPNLSNKYGWDSSNVIRKLKFNLYDELDTSKNGDLDYETEYDVKYSCAVGDYIIDHSKNIKNDQYKIKSKGVDDNKELDVVVEGTYVANSSDTKRLEPEVYAEKCLEGTDTEILYKVPTRVSFVPTYLMRSDYSVNNYEVDNVKESCAESEGNREKVWVLGSKERTMNVYNLYSVKITGASETKVQAPWSTDKRDKNNFNETGKPTVKAGSAYKLNKTDVTMKVESVVYLLDENFYSGAGLSEVRKFNDKAIKSHEDLLDKIKDCLSSEGRNGAYSFVYTSLPGGYDDNLSNKYSAFKNKFTNVVKGLKQEYTDTQFNKVFNKTKVKAKINYKDIGTTVSCNYFNKDYGDSNYTISDYEGKRGFKIRVDGKYFYLNPSVLNISSDALVNNAIDEVAKSKNEALKEYYSQLQRTTKAGKSWYKEDFEGVLRVTITSNISFQLDSDYSIIWDNLSDWQDKVGVKPYDEAKPSEIKFNGDSDVELKNSNPNITSKIPAGEIGAGYGFIIPDIKLSNVDFGDSCMMLKPYLFEVRGNVYDDISK